jgi:hypothetical protein
VLETPTSRCHVHLSALEKLRINICHMTKTFRDFDTRSQFIEYLGLYPKRPADYKDFVKIHTIPVEHFQSELQDILANINVVEKTWNDQSINAIERSVAKKGQRQLDIMQAQRREKLQAGYAPDQPMYRIKNCGADSVFSALAQHLGLDHGLARYHVQFPGEVTAWHTDIFSPSHEFLADDADPMDDASVGKDNNIRRVLIALQPWQQGHMMQFGRTFWFDWRAGDVISWDYGVPHGSANMGYQPRISVSITGKITDRFIALNHDARKI